MPQPRRVVKSVRAGFNATGATLAAKRVMRNDAANGVQAIQLATAATQTLLGVAMADIIDDDTGDVQLAPGVAVCDSGAAVAIDDVLTVDATGRVIPSTTDNHNVIGLARTAAAGADEEVEVELFSPGTQRGS